MRKDRGLNILQYEKQTRLINSLLDGQEMRNGKSSLKSFCDLGLKLESCWVTHRHRPDHGLLRALNSVDLVPVNPKAAISSLHQIRIPSPR